MNKVIGLCLSCILFLCSFGYTFADTPVTFAADQAFSCTSELLSAKANQPLIDGSYVNVLCQKNIEETSQRLVTIEAWCFGRQYKLTLILSGSVKVEHAQEYISRTKSWHDRFMDISFVDVVGVDVDRLDDRYTVIRQTIYGLEYDGTTTLITLARIEGPKLIFTMVPSGIYVEGNQPTQNDHYFCSTPAT